MKSNQSIQLFFKQGSSDKQYNASLQVCPGGNFVVNFAYGRTGNTLKHGTKTNEPIPYDVALAIYNSLVAEKMGKGYTPKKGAAPFTVSVSEDAVAKKVSGLLPQLLNPIDEDQAEFLISLDNWWMQEKHDGKRIMIRKQNGTIEGINRKGLVVALPEAVEKAAKNSTYDWVIDGELCGDVFFAFDMLVCGSSNTLAECQYSTRLSALTVFVNNTNTNGDAIRVTKTFATPKAKLAAFKEAIKLKREGVVFKDAKAPYSVGRPSKGGPALKFKFVATATLVVIKVNGKRSVLLGAEGKEVGQAIPLFAVGNCTIPPNQPMPKMGDFIEVQYLYAYPNGGSLTSP